MSIDLTPDTLLEAQERVLYEIARVDGAQAERLDHLRARYQHLKTALFEWLLDGGYEPRWDRWPIAARAFTRSTR